MDEVSHSYGPLKETQNLEIPTENGIVVYWWDACGHCETLDDLLKTILPKLKQKGYTLVSREVTALCAGGAQGNEDYTCGIGGTPTIILVDKDGNRREIDRRTLQKMFSSTNPLRGGYKHNSRRWGVFPPTVPKHLAVRFAGMTNDGKYWALLQNSKTKTCYTLWGSHRGARFQIRKLKDTSYKKIVARKTPLYSSDRAFRSKLNKVIR